jgi:hypothetical protein
MGGAPENHDVTDHCERGVVTLVDLVEVGGGGGQALVSVSLLDLIFVLRLDWNFKSVGQFCREVKVKLGSLGLDEHVEKRMITHDLVLPQ